MNEKIYYNFCTNIVDEGFIKLDYIQCDFNKSIYLKPEPPVLYIISVSYDLYDNNINFDNYINDSIISSNEIEYLTDNENNFKQNLFKSTIFLHIFLTNNLDNYKKDVLNNINLFNENNKYNVFWICDTVNKEIFCGKNHPNKINNIEKILLYSMGKENIKKPDNNREFDLNKKTYMTFSIILINIIIFVFMMLFNYRKEFINLFGNSNYYISQYNQYYRLFTSMFIHSDIIHLVENTLSLYIFGRITEKFYGSLQMILIYMISGIFGSILSFIFNTAISIGASGAIFGLIACVLYITKKNKKIIYLIGINYYTMLVLVFVNIFSGFMVSRIDNFAHIGGFISGIVISNIIYKHNI